MYNKKKKQNFNEALLIFVFYSLFSLLSFQQKKYRQSKNKNPATDRSTFNSSINPQLTVTVSEIN